MVKHKGYASVLISDYIIFKNPGAFTSYQIGKLVYIAHGRTLALTDRPLINDRIEAWKCGPIIPVLYHELFIWKDCPVTELRYTGTTPLKDSAIDERCKELFENTLPEQERSIIDVTIKHYGDWHPGDLRKMCHERGSPWDVHYDGMHGTEIPDSTIKQYYCETELIT